MKDFENLLKDEGVPITETEISDVFKQTVTDSGSKISNDSAYSPFWRLISAIAVQPVTWLVNALVQNVMPQFFLKTVGEGFIDLWGNNYGVERKQAQKLEGRILFTRADAQGDVDIPLGTVIQTELLNDMVYGLETTSAAVLEADQTSISVAVQALAEGKDYNLETGHYVKCDIEGITVTNPDSWIDVVGDDYEDIEDYRLRIRNAFNSLSHYHTDGVYRYLIAQFAGVSTDMIWFEHEVTRGGDTVIPGAADAYVLFELDAPADSYIEIINRMINDEGYHGHGDDLQVFKLPELYVDLSVTVYLPTALLDSERMVILTGVEQAIEAAFRSNSAYVMTQTQPYSRFSFTRLASEVYQNFPEIESIEFDQGDIVTELEVPRLNSLNVQEG
ncbi:hypothetical protein MED121_07250 [Marinomonas sp. MED121]|uniref:baseplate J/gp47 family protein n=1 Tax=Marinomonas sp. MED121 TaxID=314277 RepID=UPI00006903DC|nr:baseplate J/gp47 family protein [Marinomonas sp. MED121]EAQ66461.1 hypothetical protein MED121_07250 [Marinomonas sp. MED121]